ncbi:hypothetical protein [Sinimarinibacterium sp. NLF-5-8]|uniref:hypothetical protein n=1 Tax=Sinimarinibacterium sp. NLF-5-8 TaxID=2698684 RepID=UPI00137BCB2C|nr:hypothetical protein [Sinimarinibacterium sp. NLF-5-8]QHS09462.1 hypothetical protein GT972_04335 [Sinimarinibacterium sp. NLF-5-8]
MNLRHTLPVTLVCSAMLSACAGGASRHCMGDLPYQKAENLTLPTHVEGLTIPDSAAALRIPAEPERSVAFDRQIPDPQNPEKMRIECLDLPPRAAFAADTEQQGNK